MRWNKVRYRTAWLFTSECGARAVHWSAKPLRAIVSELLFGIKFYYAFVVRGSFTTHSGSEKLFPSFIQLWNQPFWLKIFTCRFGGSATISKQWLWGQRFLVERDFETVFLVVLFKMTQTLLEAWFLHIPLLNYVVFFFQIISKQFMETSCLGMLSFSCVVFVQGQHWRCERKK